MAIQIECPSCFEILSVPDPAAGGMFRCGVCQTVIRVPGEQPTDDIPAAELLPNESHPSDRRAAERAGRDERKDPPRRRTRRAAARRTGRGTGFWVAVASGVALLLAVVVGGALYAALGMTRWQEHTSDRGGFRVELPGEPRDDLVRLVPKPVPGLVVEGTVLRLRREEYLVGYFEVPAERRKAGEQVLLRDGVTGMANAYPGSRVTQDDPIVVSDFPGREVVIEVPDKGTAVGRVVLAESRAYLVLAASPGATADNPRARRFLDSFAVTDPQLIAQGRARREAARLAAEAVEEQRRKAEEGFRKREEELRAQEQKRKEEAEARERAYQALLQKSRDEFRTPGRPAPDPYCVPGLVLHLGFEEDQPLWPAGAGKLDIAEGAVRGPGPRGSALYLPSIGRVTLRDLSPAVRHALGESATLAGWVKLRFRPLTLVEADGGRRVVGHLTVGGGRLVFNTRGGRDASADDRAPPGGTRVTAPWQRDDQWHHVAAVRERRRADERLALYLDGQPVGELTAGPA